MNQRIYVGALSVVGLGFAVFFFGTMGPPFWADPDLIGAFAAGFVNPFSTGYAVDTICCWAILAILVVYERKRVRWGWLCLLLGVVPGVATGLALFLLLHRRALATASGAEPS